MNVCIYIYTYCQQNGLLQQEQNTTPLWILRILVFRKSHEFGPIFLRRFFVTLWPQFFVRKKCQVWGKVEEVTSKQLKDVLFKLAVVGDVFWWYIDFTFFGRFPAENQILCWQQNTNPQPCFWIADWTFTKWKGPGQQRTLETCLQHKRLWSPFPTGPFFLAAWTKNKKMSET